MILKGHNLHVRDHNLDGTSQEFAMPFMCGGVDEDQYLDMLPYALRTAVFDMLGELARWGRRIDSRTTWWASTHSVLTGDELSPEVATVG